MAGGLGGGAEQRSLSVSHKLGSEKSHGTPSKDERREGGGGGEQLFGVFLPLPRWLMCFRTLSVVLSRAVISFCHFLFCCGSSKGESLDRGSD